MAMTVGGPAFKCLVLIPTHIVHTIKPLKYEYDTKKAELNLSNHGLHFNLLSGFDWSTALVAEDTRRNYGESRFIAIGRLAGRVVVLVFALRDENVRAISLRKANRREVRRYEENIETH